MAGWSVAFTVLLLGAVWAQEEQPDAVSSVLGEARALYRLYEECSAKDVSPCLKLKLVALLDRVARSVGELRLTDGVSFVRDPQAPVPQGPPQTENELEGGLPRSLEDKEDSLDTLIVDKVLGFFRTHTLQMKLASSDDSQRSLTEEGRRKKQGAGLLLIPLMMAGTLVPVALGALALLAGKALLVSKLALVLSAIIGLKKLLSNNEHDSSYQVVSIPGGHHGHYGRSLDLDLPYRAHKPQ